MTLCLMSWCLGAPTAPTIFRQAGTCPPAQVLSFCLHTGGSGGFLLPPLGLLLSSPYTDENPGDSRTEHGLGDAEDKLRHRRQKAR